MNALITGGAGFLGSHLVDRLLLEGWDKVFVLDNLITGSLSNLAHLESDPRLVFHEVDVSESVAVEEPVDFVFHFASPASPDDFTRYPIEVMKVGSLGTINALELARTKGAKFMMASTSEIYGDPLISPQPETLWGNVNSIGPRSVYDEAKRFSEAITMAYRNYRGLDTRIVRFFNTYGPRMRLDDGRVVPNFIRQALLGEPLSIYGDGSNTRSFGYYEDVITGVYLLATHNYQEPVNIGTEEERTILEFAHAVINASHSSSEIVYLPAAIDDPKQRRPDLTRARKELGYEYHVELEEGLFKTIEFFKAKLGLA